MLRLSSSQFDSNKLLSDQVGEQFDDYLASHLNNVHEVVLLYTESKVLQALHLHEPPPRELVYKKVQEMFPKLKEMNMMTVVWDTAPRGLRKDRT